MYEIYKLNQQEQTVLNEMTEGINSFKKVICVSHKLPVERFVRLYVIALASSPNAFAYNSNRIQVKFGILKNELILTPLFPNDRIYRSRDIFHSKLKSIVSSLYRKGMSRYDFCAAAHDYMVRNIAYDYSVQYNPQSYSPWGALINGCAVCEGIALAYANLLNVMNIKCGIIMGKSIDDAAELHAWNIVNINDSFFHADITWDINYSKNKNRIFYNNFGLTDEDAAKKHIWNRAELQPCNTMQYNYFVVNDLYAKNPLELKRILKKQIPSRLINVRIDDGIRMYQDSVICSKITKIIQEHCSDPCVLTYHLDKDYMIFSCEIKDT